MKLEQFKQSNKRKKIIITASVIAIILISAIVLLRTYAIFETKHEYNVIKGRVTNYEVSDITITSYLDGTPSKTVPLKNSSYAVESVLCNNGAVGFWNYTNWELNIQNLTSTRTKCKVYFVKAYKEPILNGADPNLSENLIPVTILNDGTVKKADITKEWYKYEEKKWANAVILDDESVVYQNEDVIPLSNIESYFVYIPRYKYKIFSEGKYYGLITTASKVQEIDVVFEAKTTPVSNGSTVGNYLSHPAFTSFLSNGMWVGKFDTGYKGATTTQSAYKNEADSSKVVIKPNHYIWTALQASTAHLNSYHYQRNLDSHMMKNTEWGAVAYLHHSKYGSQASVRINNNSANITGYAATNEPSIGYNYPDMEGTPLNTNGTKTMMYNTSTGYLASTTGNISGIYDMSGGVWKMVLGIMKDSSGPLMSGYSLNNNSGFTGRATSNEMVLGIPYPDEKYYDAYQYSTDVLVFSNRILGDATGEMGPFSEVTPLVSSSWYQDRGRMLSVSTPFFMRSSLGGEGKNAGIFSFHSDYGSAMAWVGYRIVLTI